MIYGQVRTGGAITFLHTTDGNSKLHLVITLAGHEVEEIGDIYFDDEVVPLDGSGNATGKYAGFVRVQKKLGTDTQTAFADLITEASDKWTADHRQRGRACVYVRLTHNSDLFASGIPNIAAIVKGKKVYDPRTSTTAWSANAALCLADYLTDPIRGLGVDYATRIDETDLIAAANVCDENVTLAAGGTEDRYTCNGTFDTSQRPRDIIASMTGAMAGRASLVGGTWSIFAGAYTAPTITLTEADLRGPIRVSSRLSRRDLANGVKGTFVSPDNKWQASDFPPVSSSTAVTDDGGERLWRDIDLPFTTSAATAQRLARIELRRARQQISVQLAAKLTAYRLVPGDVVGLT
ncbi:MAG: phage tail protein, partial [bacterium]